jgi:hypothetical protein
LSLSLYEMFFLGMVVGGLAVLVIFSMLAMARQGEEEQALLEIALCQAQAFPARHDQESTPMVGENRSMPIAPEERTRKRATW